MFRHALALLVSPLAAIFCFWAVFSFEEWHQAAGVPATEGGGLLGLFLFFGLPTYAVALFIGVPTIVLFRVLGVRALAPHCLATFLMGLVVGLYIDFGWDFTLLSVVAGGLSGCLYWVLAFRVLAAVEAKEAELYGS